MTVAELIAFLQMMPQNAPVKVFNDGMCRFDGSSAWLARGGHVIIGNEDDLDYASKWLRDREDGPAKVEG